MQRFGFNEPMNVFFSRFLEFLSLGKAWKLKFWSTKCSKITCSPQIFNKKNWLRLTSIFQLQNTENYKAIIRRSQANDSCHAYETLRNSQISNLINSYKSTVDQIINKLQTMDTSRQKSKNRKGKNYAKIDVFSDSDCQAKSSQSLEKNFRKTHSIGRFRYSSKNSPAFWVFMTWPPFIFSDECQAVFKIWNVVKTLRPTKFFYCFYLCVPRDTE